MHHRASTILMVFSDRRSNFSSPFERYSNFGFGRDVTLRTESNLRTSLRSSVYSVYYRTGRCRIKAVPQRPAVKDISRKSPCETYIYIYTPAWPVRFVYPTPSQGKMIDVDHSRYRVSTMTWSFTTPNLLSIFCKSNRRAKPEKKLIKILTTKKAEST